MQRLTTLAIFLVIGFFAQFIDGTVGMGYGAFSASILIGVGIMPALASASVHTAEIFTTLISGVSHWKFGNVKKEWLLLLVIPGAIGGGLGAYFLASVPGNTMKPFVAGFLLIMGVLILYRFIRPKKEVPNSRLSTVVTNPKVSKQRIGALGFVAAFFDAVGGGGWGPIATPGLILTENTEPRKVIGTVNMAEFFITIVIAGTFFITLGTEEYDWTMIGMLLLGGVIAAPLAAYLCKKLPARILGIIVGVALIVYNLRTLLLTIF
ncbi:MAG: sulfite exporter TauE/SafE family protein [Chloroflexota bacterium]|nr:MAG: sulfite exporter TauE/SafE family protein [Chloroflexota bacterium]